MPDEGVIFAQSGVSEAKLACGGICRGQHSKENQGGVQSVSMQGGPAWGIESEEDDEGVSAEGQWEEVRVATVQMWPQGGGRVKFVNILRVMKASFSLLEKRITNMEGEKTEWTV